MTVLAFVAAAHVNGVAAAASDRFKPSDPAFVVASIKQVMPDQELRARVEAWRADPSAEGPAVALAGSLLEHARNLREPTYVGRAEAVLAAVAGSGGAESRRLYAETLQYRHDFAAAEQLLDRVIDESPRDAAARTQRASVRLVRGDFAGARSDCARLMLGADSGIAMACLAEAYAGSGQFEQALTMLERFPMSSAASQAATSAYLLTVRGELRERARDLDGAVADYRAALQLAPRDDSIRASLADALSAQGDAAAASLLLDVERPSLALLVRRTLVSAGAQRAELRERSLAWLALETARGDAVHNREAAMLALGDGDGRRALSAALANFEVQKELPDVRVLARAAVAAHDPAAQAQLRDWLHKTGFKDVVSERILSNSAAG